MKFIDASLPRFLVAGAVNTGLTYLGYLLLLQVATTASRSRLPSSSAFS